MSAEADLTGILACPCEDHGALSYAEDGRELTCAVCARCFPVEDDIPVLILERALRS